MLHRHPKLPTSNGTQTLLTLLEHPQHTPDSLPMSLSHPGSSTARQQDASTALQANQQPPRTMSASVPVKKDPLLWKASREGNEKLKKKTHQIKAGVGLEEVGGKHQSTPFLEAVLQQGLAVCKVLARRGADVKAVSNQGSGILHMGDRREDQRRLGGRLLSFVRKRPSWKDRERGVASQARG